MGAGATKKAGFGTTADNKSDPDQLRQLPSRVTGVKGNPVQLATDGYRQAGGPTNRAGASGRSGGATRREGSLGSTARYNCKGRTRRIQWLYKQQVVDPKYKNPAREGTSTDQNTHFVGFFGGCLCVGGVFF